MKIVFIHGSGANGKVWKFQTAFFAGSDAVDLPGHPEGELLPTIEDCVEWLKRYVDRKGYSDLVLVGHSLGGAVALLYALEHPDDLRGMVTVGSGARLRVLPATLELLAAATDDPKSFDQVVRSSWQTVDPETATMLRAETRVVGPAAYLNDLRACDRFDVMERLGEVRTPTLAICGSEDVQTPPKYSHFLAQHIPNARVELIEGGTHMVFLEKPDEVNGAIDRFSKSL